MLLKVHKVMTPDRRIKYLSRHYVKVCTHMADGESKTVYLKNILTALRQQWKWSVAGHELSQGARKQDQPWDKFARSRECW